MQCDFPKFKNIFKPYHLNVSLSKTCHIPLKYILIFFSTICVKLFCMYYVVCIIWNIFVFWEITLHNMENLTLLSSSILQMKFNDTLKSDWMRHVKVSDFWKVCHQILLNRFERGGGKKEENCLLQPALPRTWRNSHAFFTQFASSWHQIHTSTTLCNRVYAHHHRWLYLSCNTVTHKKCFSRVFCLKYRKCNSKHENS